MTIQDLRVPFQVLMGSPLHNHVGQKPQKRKTKECQDHSVFAEDPGLLSHEELPS